MDFGTVLYDTRDRVATITLNRPERFNTQMVATLFDGMARHSPEGIWFKQRAEEVGFKQAVAERDSGDPIPGSEK